MAQELANMDATEVVASFKSGRLSPATYAEAIVERVEKHAGLNSLQSFDAVGIAQRATDAFAAHPDGALAGLPIVVKDNINTVNFPTSGGTRALLDHITSTDAGVVSALHAAGGCVSAKAGMHELAFGITSNNAVTGAIGNPVDPTLIPGGSSGGTAAAIGAGIFPAGLGTDTGGSCRIPAALCGIKGLRPTTGRYATDGIVPIAHTRDTPGPLARSVRDIALFDAVLSGEYAPVTAADLSSVTLGVPHAVFYDDLDPHVATTIDTQLTALSAAGARLVDVSFDGIWVHNAAFGFPVVLYEMMRDLPAYLVEHAPEISFDTLFENIGSPDVARAIGSQLGDDAISQEAYRAAIEQHRPAMRQIYAQAFDAHELDAIVFPTTPLPARPIGQDETIKLNGAAQPTFRTYVRNTDLGSNLGVPGISLPCPVGAGLPVGIEFDALAGQDRRLLEIALAVERLFA